MSNLWHVSTLILEVTGSIPIRWPPQGGALRASSAKLNMQTNCLWQLLKGRAQMICFALLWSLNQFTTLRLEHWFTITMERNRNSFTKQNVCPVRPYAQDAKLRSGLTKADSESRSRPVPVPSVFISFKPRHLYGWEQHSKWTRTGVHWQLPLIFQHMGAVSWEQLGSTQHQQALCRQRRSQRPNANLFKIDLLPLPFTSQKESPHGEIWSET